MEYEIYVRSLAGIPVFLSLWGWLLKSKVLVKFQTLQLTVLSEKRRLTWDRFLQWKIRQLEESLSST